ncbi:MAG TPA: hypothetical protein VIZ17_11330 [Acetobacteraceae bacterium]
MPDMPRSAQRHVNIDYSVRVGALGGLLVRLVHEPAGETPEIPDRIKLETAIAAQELAGMASNDQLGSPSRFACPECHGTLWEVTDGGLLRYRCHVGHALTGEAMLAAQAKQSEEMLWSLMRPIRSGQMSVQLRSIAG